MLFQKRFVESILSGQKTRTTRFRKHAKVKVGGVYKAKVNRFSKDFFALVKVVSIRSADYVPHSEFRSNAWISNLSAVINSNYHQRHAEKEGMADWYEFRDVYTELNAKHRDDAERKHWIIDFGVVNAQGQFIATKYQIGDWVSWDRNGQPKTAQVLDIVYSDWNRDWCYKLDMRIGEHSDFYEWEMEDKLQPAVGFPPLETKGSIE